MYLFYEHFFPLSLFKLTFLMGFIVSILLFLFQVKIQKDTKPYFSHFSSLSMWSCSLPAVNSYYTP